MLADLKEKAAGVDRKRVYTAAAALLIAGAAGHFMQRTSGGSGGPAVMTASVPPVSAPEILTAPPQAGAPDVVAKAPDAALLPADDAAATASESLAEAAPAMPAPLAPEADIATADPAVMPAEIAPAPDAGTTMAEAAPADVLKRVAPEMDMAAAEIAPSDPAEDQAMEIATLVPEMMRPKPKPDVVPDFGVASTSIYPAPKADLILEEVTRAATDPLLAIKEPAPERPEDSVFAAASDEINLPPPTAVAPAEPEIAGCDIDVQASAKAGALLEISISAPCNSGESVAFDHAGLKFSEQLGPDGSLVLEVPAMTGTARVGLSFDDGADEDVQIAVPDFDAFDRIAVIWKGATGLQLHALEGGAGYDDDGHVWADTPGTPDAAINGTGGFMSVLGSTASGFAADVYTYPDALMRQGIEPEVSIEAQVMENTCGGEIEGWILRTNPGRAPNVEPLTMVVPGCEAVGEFLVLRDLPVELKLARR